MDVLTLYLTLKIAGLVLGAVLGTAYVVLRILDR